MQNAQVVEPVSLFTPRAFDEQKVKQSIAHISDSPVILLLVVAPAFSIPGHLAFVTGPGLIAPIVVPKVLLVYPIFSSIPCHALIELLKGNHACRDSLILPFLVSILPMMETPQGRGSRERIKDKGSYGVIPEVDDLGGGVGSKSHLLSVLVFPGVPDSATLVGSLLTSSRLIRGAQQQQAKARTLPVPHRDMSPPPGRGGPCIPPPAQ